MSTHPLDSCRYCGHVREAHTPVCSHCDNPGLDDQCEAFVETNFWQYGRFYLIEYQIPDVHRVPRYGLAKLIEGDTEAVSLSGRPVFGTTDLQQHWISNVKRVDATDTDCFMDRKSLPAKWQKVWVGS